MSTTSPDPAAPMLVVGATGYLGSQVVEELLARGKNVRALVRPSTDVTKLEAQGVQIARGDVLDPDSLLAAMLGADTVITTAAGYTGSNKNATEIDTVGNANLAAASKAGVRHFVLTSILTSDRTPDVPHPGTRNCPRTHSNVSAPPSLHSGPAPCSIRSPPSAVTPSPRAASCGWAKPAHR